MPRKKILRIFTALLMFTGFAGPILAQVRMISHLTRSGGGFNSTIQIENRSVLEQRLSLNAFDESGNALATQAITLAGLSVISQTALELFGENSVVSHFSIEADDSVNLTVAYNFNGPGSPAHVPESSEQASSWRIFSGDWNFVFDGFAVVNRGEVATDIWIAQKDNEGNIIQSEQVAASLAPNAKALYVLGGPGGSSFTAAANTVFELSAEQSLAVTALRGTVPGSALGLLWSNQAAPQSRATNKRDDRSVWFINGGSLYDSFETMGYNLAKDRLWQMEVFKRTARGRLAETFGPTLLDQDVIVRESSYSDQELTDLLNNLDEESQVMIKAYMRGINRHIAQVNSNPSLVPYEFRLLNIQQVDFWTDVELMSWIALVQRTFSLDNFGARQLENGALAQRLIEISGSIMEAAQRFEDLRWPLDPATPTMIPKTAAQKQQAVKKGNALAEWKNLAPDMQGFAENLKQRLERNKEELLKVGGHVKMGSYAWVVSGSKTASGNPIIYAGPQLDNSGPGLVLEGSIENAAFSVSGMVVPGIPGIIVGRTPNHAWSFQVGHTHTWDYYLEGLTDITLDRIETLKVAGGDDVELYIYRSVRGPIMFRTNRGPALPGELFFSWRYSHWGKEFDLSKGILAMAKAQNMDEFGEGVANLGLSQHICYADKDGNIGYWLSGRNPVRPEGNYRFPQGTILEALDYDLNVVHPPVHGRNPARGWYGGWNNLASLDVGDPSATFAFGPMHRAHVIEEYLTNNDNLNFEDLKKLAEDISLTNNSHGGGFEWPIQRDLFRFKEIVENNPTPERMEALQLIESWNGLFPKGGRDGWLTSPDFEEAFLTQRFWSVAFMDFVFGDEIGFTDNQIQYQERFGTVYHALSQDTNIVNFFDWFLNDEDPNAPQTLEDAVLAALDLALQIVGPRPWGIGAREVDDYFHDLLGSLHRAPFLNRATYAQCVELDAGGPIRIETVFPLGMSGTVLADENFRPVTAAGTPVGNGTEGAEPVAGDPFFGMRDLYDSFTLRPFPLFRQD